jgi:adenylate cyclase
LGAGVTAGGAYNTIKVMEIFDSLGRIMLLRRLRQQKLNTSQIIGLTAALMILATGLLVCGLTYSHLSSQLRTTSIDDSTRQLRQLSVALTPSLLRQDRISLNLTLNDWDSGNALDGIRVLDTEQQILAERGQEQTSNQTITVPVLQDGKNIGAIIGFANTDAATQLAQRYFSIGLIASSVLALLGALIAYQFGERHSYYTRRLQQQMLLWQQGEDLTLPTKPRDADNLALHLTLEKIARRESQKRAMDVALGQFMSNSDSPYPDPLKYYDAALLFIEIQDLEILQNRLSASELTQTLNQYHRLLSQAAKLYNGKVDRYLGDGVVMMFGIPNNDRNASLHCLYAARLFSGLVNYLREHDSPLLALEFHIAAHWGPVLMAPLQEDNHTQCNLIGDTVHWASHLANQSEENRILVSHTLIEHIDEELGIEWHEGPLVSDLHGREQITYWLKELPEKTESLIQRQIKHITSMTENA